MHWSCTEGTWCQTRCWSWIWTYFDCYFAFVSKTPLGRSSWKVNWTARTHRNRAEKNWCGSIKIQVLMYNLLFRLQRFPPATVFTRCELQFTHTLNIKQLPPLNIWEADVTPKRWTKINVSIFIETINFNLVYRNAIKDLVNILFKTLLTPRTWIYEFYE